MENNRKDKFASIDLLYKIIKEHYKDDIYYGRDIILPMSEIDTYSPEAGDIFLNSPDLAFDYLASLEKEDNLSFQLRITDLYNQIPISSIRHNHLYKLIMVRGMIRSVAEVKPTAKSITFECQSCGHLIEIHQDMDPSSTVKQPIICTNCGKKSRFKAISKDLIDTQFMSIEEPQDELDKANSTSIPCILMGNLVDPSMSTTISPGNKIEVVGILREKDGKNSRGGNIISSSFILYPISIKSIEQAFYKIVISDEEKNKIIEFSKDPMFFDKLKSSIAPEIYGYDDIKEAILLQLFGGSYSEKKRPEIHILLVGDPGRGKTQVLRSVTKLAPKGIYVSGTASTGVGLTATVTKTQEGWLLEAGALSLANNGMIAIDELDKMPKEQSQALHEALETGQVVVNKASIHSTLRTKVSALAAANPKLGQFSKYDPIAMQIDLQPSLINRFDLVFFLRADVPEDEEMAIAHKIFEPEDEKISPDFVRKYIAYARQNLSPQHSKEAMDLIITFYMDILKQASKLDNTPIPISPRQLEAIKRLAEASAKARLSDTVSIEDAQRAINLEMKYLKTVGIDPQTGMLDIGALEGMPSSFRAQVMLVKKAIYEITSMSPSGEVEFREIVKQTSLDEDLVDKAIEQLKMSNIIYEPKPGRYARIRMGGI